MFLRCRFTVPKASSSPCRSRRKLSQNGLDFNSTFNASIRRCHVAQSTIPVIKLSVEGMAAGLSSVENLAIKVMRRGLEIAGHARAHSNYKIAAGPFFSFGAGSLLSQAVRSNSAKVIW